MEMSFTINVEQVEGVRRHVFGIGNDPINFAFWDVQGDIVRDNVARYAAESGETVACWEIGRGYDERLTEALAAGNGPDVFYAQRAEASLWGAMGWVAALDEAGFAPLLLRMDRRMVDGARDGGGQVLGMTYYNGGPFALFGHADYAETSTLDLTDWVSMLDFLRRAKREGLSQHPFLPRWHRSQTGLTWSLICHLASEGILSLGQDGAAANLIGVLEVFQTLVEEDLVPPESLDDQGDAPALARWVSGRHVLNFTTDYLAMDAAKASGRGVNIMLPLPGAHGRPLMPGHALLCLRAGIEGHRRQRAENLLRYLGGTAPNGQLRVHDRWLRQCLFGVPYGELQDAPGMHAAMAAAFVPEHAGRSVQRLIAARAAAVMSPMTQRPCMLEWTQYADRTIREDLLRRRDLSAAEASARLIDRWQALDGK